MPSCNETYDATSFKGCIDSHYEQAIANLTKQIEAFAKETGILRDTIYRKEETIQQLEKKADELMKEREELYQKKRELEENVDSLHRSLARRMEEIDALKAQFNQPEQSEPSGGFIQRECPYCSDDRPEESVHDFGWALRQVKAGWAIARTGWNGKGLKVIYQKGYPQGIPCNEQTAKAWGMKPGDLFKCEPYLQISTVDGSHAMWVPSIRDVLATDWMIVIPTR